MFENPKYVFSSLYRLLFCTVFENKSLRSSRQNLPFGPPQRNSQVLPRTLLVHSQAHCLQELRRDLHARRPQFIHSPAQSSQRLEYFVKLVTFLAVL